MEGLGKIVPPLKKHVIIYFMQKDCPKSEALEFYGYFQNKAWKNNKGGKLSNWKMAAWEWIFERTYSLHKCGH